VVQDNRGYATQAEFLVDYARKFACSESATMFIFQLFTAVIQITCNVC